MQVYDADTLSVIACYCLQVYDADTLSVILCFCLQVYDADTACTHRHQHTGRLPLLLIIKGVNPGPRHLPACLPLPAGV